MKRTLLLVLALTATACTTTPTRAPEGARYTTTLTLTQGGAMSAQSMTKQDVVLSIDELGAPLGESPLSSTVSLRAQVQVRDAATGAAVESAATLTGNNALDVTTVNANEADVLPAAPGVGIVTATPALAGAPAQTATLRVYAALSVGDAPERQSQRAPGVRLADGAKVATIAGADVYLTSPAYPEGDEHREDGMTLHFPGGILAVDDEKLGAPLIVGERDWAAAPTTLALPANPWGTMPDDTRYLVRDLSGQVFKLRLVRYGGSVQVVGGQPVPGTGVLAPELWYLAANADGSFDY